MHQAAVWLRDVQAGPGEDLQIEWRYFSLQQVNSTQGEDWKMWDQREEDARGLVAFKAAEAARRQGTAAFESFHYALLEARHVHGQELNREVVTRVAEESGLDPTRFKLDLDDPDIVSTLARDHEHAVGLGVFGTPTIFFEEGKGAFVKMRPAPERQDAATVFETLRSVVAGHPNIAEIKRPRVYSGLRKH